MVKNLLTGAGDTRDMGLIPGLGRSLGVAVATLSSVSCLEHYMGGKTWLSTVYWFTDLDMVLPT